MLDLFVMVIKYWIFTGAIIGLGDFLWTLYLYWRAAFEKGFIPIMLFRFVMIVVTWPVYLWLAFRRIVNGEY